MALYITALASGSNGNCYYIGNDTEAVLVDAGITCREIERRMKSLGLDLNRVKAIFVSHEHSDHIQGIPVLAKKYALPVYITPPTLRSGRLFLDGHLVRSFSNNETVSVGALTVTPFSKLHDACDPYSFTIAFRGLKVGVFTDIGHPCAALVRHFGECHAAFLEANYDEEMLERGSYPYHLKNRIRGGRGHLSNRQALELFRQHRPPHMSHLLLAHLSKNNNCPKLVQQLFTGHARGTDIVVASRTAPTAVYAVRADGPVRTDHAAYIPPVQQLEFSFL